MWNMYNYYPQKSKAIIYLVVAAFAFALGWLGNSLDLTGDNPPVDDGSGQEISISDWQNEVDLGLFWTVWSELMKKYVEEDVLDAETMVYGAIKGMVNALDDPHTAFMTPQESEDFSASLDGTLEGIGAELNVREGELVVASPLRDSPAERAGLLPGDIIYKINDEYASDMSLFEAIAKIRGEKGTSVTLTILRESEDEPFEVSIVRDSIDIESITVEELGDGITYLSVNQFNDKTIAEFNVAVSEMILSEPNGLIVDLRYNGGGYLDIAVDLLSFLLPSGSEAVRIEQRDKDPEIMQTNGNAKLLNVPLVVLVNEGSASASEIVAGAIQDHRRGVIMGTQTFGKGTVQEVESFSDGSSIRLTIARWLTPKKRSIDKVGLTPDIIVEISESDAEKDVDTQKERAIEYLRNL